MEGAKAVPMSGNIAKIFYIVSKIHYFSIRYLTLKSSTPITPVRHSEAEADEIQAFPGMTVAAACSDKKGPAAGSVEDNHQHSSNLSSLVDQRYHSC